MSTTARAPALILQNQNLDIHHKRSAAKGLSDGLSKPAQKKGVGGLGNRKALKDISNSSTIRQEKETSRKTNKKKDEFNIAEEMFLHDHNRCVEVRKAEMNRNIMDTLLFEHGLLYPTAASPKSKQAEVGIASSPPRYLEKEPVPELQMLEISELCHSPIQWDSPPPSPSWISLKMTWTKVMLPRGELSLRRSNSSMSAPRVDNTHTEVYPEFCWTARDISEKQAGPNFNSLRGFEVIDEIKAILEEACPYTVSCADLLAIVARDAVESRGIPSWPVGLGRKDALKANLAGANQHIPTPNSPFQALISKSAVQGLDIGDLVAQFVCRVDDQDGKHKFAGWRAARNPKELQVYCILLPHPQSQNKPRLVLQVVPQGT